MNRTSRKQLVMDVLEKYPDTRHDTKELILLTWLEQCQQKGVCFCPHHVRSVCSSPSAIDRDRRRPETLAKFPRNEEKFEAYIEYKDEFGNGQWAFNLGDRK